MFEGALATFSATAFSLDGKTLLYLRNVHDDFGEHPWATTVEVATGKEKFHMEGHTEAIAWVGFSPDDSSTISNAWGGYAKLYSVTDGSHLPDLGPAGGQTGIRFLTRWRERCDQSSE